VTIEEARRIAVRAQLLDGSATDVLNTVRRLGFLQLDPIATVAPPQHLVLWSRLGPSYDRAELERLLWEERKLVEWNAFLYPTEDLPLLQAEMRRRSGTRAKNLSAYVNDHPAFRRYVLRELELRGPLLGREIETHRSKKFDDHRWWGTRQIGLMLQVLNMRGEVAVVGRRQNQRVWDLAERWYPETEKLTWKEAERRIDELRFRSLGVRLKGGKLEVHPEAADGPVPDRVTFLSPFDRLVHDRARAEHLWDFYYRLEMYVPQAKREYGYYVVPILHGDRIVGRIEPVHDRKLKTLRVNGTWWEKGAEPVPLEGTLDSLAGWLGAERI
jgi:uncharacterized protein YcaQ